jgi:hypothetical protein
MVRNPKVVQLSIDSVQQRDAVRTGDPYLWVVFFKADGSTLSVTDAGTVSGNCVIVSSAGSHGDLGNQTPTVISEPSPGHTIDGVDSNGDAIAVVTNEISVLSWFVPADIGLWITRITPIPVAPSVQSIVGVDKPGTFGVIVVLFNEQGHLPNHAAEAGHRALNIAVEDAINGLLRALDPSHPDITQDDINGVVRNVSALVHDAIVNDLSFSEKLWAATEADIEIGQQIWQWDQDVMTSPSGQMTFATGDNWGSPLYAQSGWRITGTLSVTDPCPADVFAYILNAFTGGSGSQLSPAPVWHDAMRTFRDNGGFRMYSGLSAWWDLAARRVPYLAALTASRDEFREEVTRLLSDLPRMLAEPDSPIPPRSVHSMARILSIISESPYADLRGAGFLGVSMLKELREGATVRRSLEVFAAVTAPSHKRS